MGKRKLKLVLWIICAACITASGLLLCLPLLPLPAPPALASDKAAHPANAPTPALPERSAFQPIWRLDLRRPLFDPPPVVVAKPVVQRPPLNVKLMGTIIEPNRTLGLFLLPDGQIQIRGVGEQAGGAEILRIDTDAAELRHQGEAVTLSVVKEGQT